jgi:hypothetical protein
VERRLVILLTLTLSGCANAQLKLSTTRSASTLTDLQYQQVLDNLAMYCEDPSALPGHVNLLNGAVQVADAGSIGTIAQTDLSHAFTWSPYFTGTRAVVTQWSTIPVTDDTSLRLLRLAYQIAVSYRGEHDLDPDLANDLAHTLKNQTATNADISLDTNLVDTLVKTYLYDDTKDLNKLLKAYVPARDSILAANDPDFLVPTDYSKYIFKTALAREVTRQVDDVRSQYREIPTGWFGCGRKRDVPRDACFVGHYKNCYTWVCPAHRSELAEFTLIVLNLASVVEETQVISPPSGVAFSPGSARTRRVERVRHLVTSSTAAELAFGRGTYAPERPGSKIRRCGSSTNRCG